MAASAEDLPKKDLTTIFTNPTDTAALSAKRQQTQQAQKNIGHKHFGGDLFYTRGEYDDGMIYLSRVDKNHMQNTESILHSRPAHRHLPPAAGAAAASGANDPAAAAAATGDGGTQPSPGVATNQQSASRGSDDPLENTSGPDGFVDDPESLELAREMKLRCAEGMYHVSCHPGQESRLIREGGLRTLTTLVKVEDPLVRMFCSVTLLNLAANKHVQLKMLDDGAISLLLDLAHTSHLQVKHYCAWALFRFSSDESHHFRMIHEGSVAILSQLMSLSNDAIKVHCMGALLNLVSSPRATASDTIMNTIVYLSKAATSLPAASNRPTTTNTSTSSPTSSRGHAAASDSNASESTGPMNNEGLEEDETLHMCARGLLNLSILPATRCNIIEEGTMVALSLMLKRPRLFEMISCVLCNLASIKTNQSQMVKNGVLTMLVYIIDELEVLPKPPPPAAAVAQAQAPLPSARAATPADGPTRATTPAQQQQQQSVEPTTGDPTSSSSSPPTAPSEEQAAYAAELARRLVIRRNCANTLAQLCCNPKLHSRIVAAGFVPRLLKLMQAHHEETDRFCILCLANLSVDDRSRSAIVSAGVVPELLRVLMDPPLDGPKNAVVTDRADPSSQSSSATTAAMSRDDQQAREAMVLKKLDCVTALSNLMLHPQNFEQMAHDGVIPTLMKLTECDSIPAIQRASVCALRNLAKDPAMKSQLADQGALSTMIAFALKFVKDTELCCICLSFLNHLASRTENVALLFQESALSLITRFLQKPLANTGNTMQKECVLLYALWLEAISTLHSMAISAKEQQIMLNEGTLEALQHFLGVTSSDLRHTDKKTYGKRVKAYFLTSGLLLKLHPLACVAENVSVFYGCILLLISASCANRSNHVDQESSRLHNKTIFVCVEILSKITLLGRAHRMLSKHTDIAPALNSVMRTGLHEAQVFAAIALCNLATERGPLLNRVWRDKTVEDFIVITLLRVNSVETKEICAKALFNLLTHEDTRDLMIKDGCLYALLKLSRLDNESIRDLCFRSLYNISLDATKIPMLLQMEIVRVLSKMYQSEYSKDMKRFLSGILSNVSSVSTSYGGVGAGAGGAGGSGAGGSGTDGNTNRAPSGGSESQLIHDGLLSLLKHLVKVRDPETKVYAANCLCNVSCNLDVAELLVRDESLVLSMLDSNLKSDSKELRKFAAMTLANLSGNAIAIQFMTKENLMGVLNDTLKRTMASCVVTCFNCVFTIRNLFAHHANQRLFVDQSGVKTLASLLSCAELEHEVETLVICSELLCALATLDTDKSAPLALQMEDKLVQDGIVKALFFIARNSKRFEKGSSSTIATGSSSSSASSASSSGSTAASVYHNKASSTMNIITSLSNLSRNVACHEQMIKDGILDAICFLCHAESPEEIKCIIKTLVPSMGESFCHQCAVTLRNLSLKPAATTTSSSKPHDPDDSYHHHHHHGHHALGQQSKIPSRAQRFGAVAGVVPVLLALCQSSNAETREHAVVTIHNIVMNKRCCSTLIRSDGVKLLLKLATNGSTSFVQHMCTLALQVLATHDDASVLQDGLVTSITALNELSVELVTTAARKANLIVHPTLLAVSSSSSSLALASGSVSTVVVNTTVTSSSSASSSSSSPSASGISSSTSSSSSTTSGTTKPMEWLLMVSQNQPIRHKSAPADWQRVSIPTLPKFPSVSDGVDAQELGEDEASDGSDDDFGQSHGIISIAAHEPVPVTPPPPSAHAKRLSGMGTKGLGLNDAATLAGGPTATVAAAAAAAAAAAPAGSINTPTTTGSTSARPSSSSTDTSTAAAATSSRASSHTNAITVPRPCNADLVLGSVEMIHDTRMDKVRIPPQLLEVEIATFTAHRHRHHVAVSNATGPQRSHSQWQLPSSQLNNNNASNFTSTSTNTGSATGMPAEDQLPKLPMHRAVTAPDTMAESAPELAEATEAEAEKKSTLKQARQQAEALVQHPTGTSATSPEKQTVRSPQASGSQRKARTLEPLGS